MPNLADLAAADDKDSSGCSTELVLEVQEEVQETFDEILKSVDLLGKSALAIFISDDPLIAMETFHLPSSLQLFQPPA